MELLGWCSTRWTSISDQNWLNTLSEVRSSSWEWDQKRRVKRESKQIPATQSTSNAVGETGDTGTSVSGVRPAENEAVEDFGSWCQWVAMPHPWSFSRYLFRRSEWEYWAGTVTAVKVLRTKSTCYVIALSISFTYYMCICIYSTVYILYMG